MKKREKRLKFGFSGARLFPASRRTSLVIFDIPYGRKKVATGVLAMLDPHLSSHVLDRSHGCWQPKRLYLKDKDLGFPLEMIVGCNQRFECQCSICSSRWKWRNFKRFKKAIQSFRHPKFLTLHPTLRQIPWPMRSGQSTFGNIAISFSSVLKLAGFSIERWIGTIELPNHLSFGHRFRPISLMVSSLALA